ncbi:SDR family oxidoreductase [Burkholderia gladioli]|uniref:Short chain dehydrogenase family protein n=1 Tax=Burkholderia gladioli TaxID=28095 RepID=A0AAW3F2C6_BURGA|nr:SDR family oxidoreductase [Burkholderia gladioli]AJW96109.1 short chain dehydrogenase family protein [Burkholderia gladioli]AWY52081.1 SDR family oxidoreductase [Burkholderia gladioli pv. gladioli]KGC13926.1 short chain dehydrogenase family protein [Burkholderia gladioli]MDJ1165594.1 SDR family oxidoreductase [Burkholderia gladioli pv. gladioli]MDN7814224.1 SDR family oxidoreductase [Burkholderia gladioli]
MAQYAELNGKVTLITGAGSGIGRTTAIAFAAQGARVVVSDINPNAGEETVKLIREADGKAIFVKTDVSKEGEVQSLIDQAVTTFGRLDIAFNNAGLTQNSALLAEQPSGTYDEIFDVTVRGVWLSMRAEIAQMLKQGGGAIVNMGSMSAVVGIPGLTTYSGSKHAVLGLTRGAALDYAKQGIRINAVGPGTINTPMIDRFVELAGSDSVMEPIRAAHPIGRTGKPEEVAEAVLWLASDASSFVVGHILMVDGGYSVQ